MRALWSAIGFLTVLPVPKDLEWAPLREAASWFPAVGWVLGAVICAVFAIPGVPDGLGAALALAAWLALTGMLHLDGLLDCADGLLAPVSLERRLEILKDVQIGAFGFGVGVVFLLLKWQAITALTSDAMWTLLAIPVWARFAVLLPMSWFPTARPDGLGARARGGNLRLAMVLTLPAVVIAPAVGGAMVLGVGIAAWLAARRLGGGLTGDVYGALIEIAELVGLLAAVILAA